MNSVDLYRFLDGSFIYGKDYEVVEVSEGVRLIRFLVQEIPDGSKLLKDATTAEVIDYADACGFILTEDDVLEIKRGSSLPVDLSQETIAEALDDYLNAFER